MAQTNVRLPDWFSPTRYTLTLEPDLKRHAFSGSVTITYTLKKPTKKLTLHALELAILEARAGSQLGSPTYDAKSETVTLTFPQALPKGTGKIHISYTGTLNDKMRGFYRSHYHVGGKDETMAVTQFESTFARFALPCVDEPAAKAVFDVTLIVDPGLTTISNTIETKTEKLDDGRTKVTYAPTPKMSTYLLAFVVGKFGHVQKKTKRGTVTRVFAPKGKEHQAEFALDVAVKCLDFFENYFKIRYPLPAIDHIAIPDFSAGAMENWGAITYRETALLFDSRESSAQNKQRIALVIAHELAHQWFGNLVTMEWWTDLWLNEGFATYIEYLAIDHIFPEWDIWTQFVDTEANEAMRLDALESTHPIEIEVHHPSEINEIFDSVSYAKGATVLRMLAAFIGPRAFQKGLHTYLKTHAYGNARTRDLWAALEKASGKPVRKVMDGWTKRGGYPVVSLTRSGSHVSLNQVRFFSSPGRKSSDRWAIPMTVHAKKKLTHLFSAARTSIVIPQNAPWVNANVGAVGMYRTKYDTASLMALGSAVASGSLAATEKVRIVNDLFALAFSNQGSIADALAFVTTFTDETEYPVWSAVCAELSKLKTLLEGSASEKSFERFVAKLLLPTRDRLDWSAKPGESHTDALLRGLIFHTLVSVNHEDTHATCRAHFAAHEKGSRLAPDVRPAVYAAFAKTDSNPVPALTKHYEHEEMHAEKNQYLVALGAVGPKHLSRALTYAMGKTVRYQDTRWTFLSAARSVRGAEVVFEVLAKHWDLIIERYGKSGHDLPRYVHCMDVFHTDEAYKKVAAFFKKHKAPGAERAVKQLLETIKARVAWRKKNLRAVEAWLTEYEASLPR